MIAQLKFPASFILCVVLFLSFFSIAANAEPSNMAHLADWVGKYPQYEEDTKSFDVLKINELNKVLADIIPKKDRVLIEKYDVSVPIERIENSIVIRNCRAHNCPYEKSIVVVDINTGSVWVSIYSESTDGTAIRLYSNGYEFNAVPSSLRNELLSNKRN
jgi:hypothetical protein